MKNMWLLIAMAILGILSIIISTWYNIKESNSAKEETTLLQTSIDRNNKIINEQSETIKSLRKDNEELRKEVTGDGNYPTLSIWTGAASHEGFNFFTAHFSLLNDSEYSLIDVRGYVIDQTALNMMRHQIYYHLKGNSIINRSPNPNDFKEWNFLNNFAAGTIIKNEESLAYVTSFGAEDCKKASYKVHAQWSRGKIHFSFDLLADKEDVRIENMKVAINGDFLPDPEKYIKFKHHSLSNNN